MSMPRMAMIVRMVGMAVAMIMAMVMRRPGHATHSTRKKAGAAIHRAY